MNISTDRERLAREIDELGLISSEPPPVVTRVVYSDADLRARRWFRGLCEEAGLTVREDAVGNTFARWSGIDDAAPPVATGSHIDAIPNAGRFDGTVGVLGGLEAMRALRRAGYQPKRPIELVLFTSEEPTRFGIGCFGSRMLAGTETGESLRDGEGVSLDRARQDAGFTGSMEGVRLARGHYRAFVELHIEQGPILEREGIDVGIVTAIAAPSTLRFELEGEGGHAGAVLMPERRDAFLAAAEIALAAEQAAKSTGAIDTVATTGICDIFPRAVNSVPSRARMDIDIRDIDGPRRDGVLRSVTDAAEQIAVRRRITIHTTVLNADPPAACATSVVDALEQACQNAGATYKRMISRAYHDSLFMAQIVPAAMLFIPCRNGVSHRPDEYASPEAMAQGALVLAHALKSLADDSSL